ncbi:helix-turn-helix domain-containing protein [Streptomyces sp. NBC_01451]|uniref:helix-turn-helix domain-containing protein n=1 Tax=Streptomyces sp. NBC_01451 TaxID=2903872 RepID=UPI002E31ECEB|nr:XRE family transcriptional regulator [Streptomyces sp. NBC_01451]
MNADLIERVLEVIGRAGPTQAAQAERLGMTPDKLSKSLNGTRRFNSLELALLAEATGTTVDWLLSGRLPRTARNVAARKNSDGGNQADARSVLQGYEGLIDALQRLGYPLPMNVPEIDFEGALAVEQGEQLARAALKHLNSSPRKWDAEELAAQCEEAFSVEIAATELPDGLDGLAWAPGDFRLIIVTSTPVWTRQRFTLAHECGHILAGDAREIVAEQVSPGRSTSLSEVRANAFAAGFLMPTDEVFEDASSPMDSQSISRLAWKYKVSPSAMATRLKALGLIKPDEYRRAVVGTTRDAALLSRALEEHLRMAGRARRGWPPQRLSELATRAYLQRDISIRPLATLWEVPPEDLLDVMEPPLVQPDDEPCTETGLVFTP